MTKNLQNGVSAALMKYDKKVRVNWRRQFYAHTLTPMVRTVQ
ncbi:hypothetical protein WCQ58_02550 [Staphylococcus pseudintermedius]|nr:hypothetical protein [Staphylococcus pseudintermedius]MDA3105450.1 hypothetical protein [Staphylococcus pseudintermedius]MDE9858795.1 hypothetical protein [Staphylococcus pseudintermedius]MDF0195767.1 hypothetical protein [Staphylococcus pseudintermedius]MDF0289106.1 hypothetical protein [Staphylococcus pseudintermedius]MDK3745921.1 hypothetical protein [Staphylococcus pseudintermedius]